MIERAISIPGGRFHYLEAGEPDAPLVLCLHGFPDHAPSFLPLMGELARAGYRAIAPWMRGYAPSVLEGPYDLERLGRDIVELAAALSPGRPVYLVGHDWGAAAAYVACAAEPARFAAAVSLAVPHPIAFFSNVPRHPAQVRRSWYILFFQLPRLPEHALARHDFALIDRLWRDWSPGYRLPAAEREALHACLAASMPAPVGHYRALLTPVRASVARLKRLSLARIRVPMLHLHGAQDGAIAPALAQGQERYFVGPFTSTVIDGAGHFIHLDAPDQTTSQILGWLKRYPEVGADTL